MIVCDYSLFIPYAGNKSISALADIKFRKKTALGQALMGRDEDGKQRKLWALTTGYFVRSLEIEEVGKIQGKQVNTIAKRKA
jgi:hypothetical protein